MTRAQAKAAIDAAIRQNISGPKKGLAALLPAGLLEGKLYEAKVLALLAKRLHFREGLTTRLVNGNNLQLSSSPGPIRRNRPHMQLMTRNGRMIGELWTDTEFLTLSHALSGAPAVGARSGFYHELDLLVLDTKNPVADGAYPRHNQIWLGVECKHTAFHKHYLREVLGVRRELSLLAPPRLPRFRRLFPAGLPARPPSALLFCCRHSKVGGYRGPGPIYGVNFLHCTFTSPSLPRF